MADSQNENLELTPHDRLQCYFDEALPEEEAAALRAEIEADEALQGQLRALSRLQEFVQLGFEDMQEQAGQELDAADADALFARITAGVAQDEAVTESGEQEASDPATGKRPNLRVIKGEGLGTLPPNQQKVRFEPKFDPEQAQQGADATSPSTEKPQQLWPTALVAVALAAAAVLAFMSNRGPEAPQAIHEQHHGTETLEGDPDQAPEGEQVHPEVQIAHIGSTVEEVDFGANTGTVFQVPGNEGAPIAVVWISEEGT